MSAIERETHELGDITEDRLLGGKLVIRQPRHGYRVAIDPVFLAAAVPARPGQRVLDAGAGVGAASLCLARRLAEVRIDGIEVQAPLRALAAANIAGNGFDTRVACHGGDILAPPPAIAAAYHHVMVNPPHMARGRANPSGTAAKDISTVESGADLRAWIGFCAGRVIDGGSLTVIHRADRLDQLLAALGGVDCGALDIFPLWPKAGRAAKRIIVQARKGRAGPTRLLAGLILHVDAGPFSDAAEAVLRAGAALPIARRR